MKLNDRQIKNAKPTETGKKTKLFDGGGLYFEVTPAGGKIFRLKYRIDGKEKTFTIGKYPTVSLVEARQAAVSNTFRNIAAEWHKHRETGLTGNHAASVWDSLGKDVFPTLGSLSISEIKVSQVKEVIEAVAARGALETAGGYCGVSSLFSLMRYGRNGRKTIPLFH